MHAVCAMGCDKGLAGAGEAGRVFACVARKLYKMLAWREVFGRFVSGLSGFGRVRECLGVSFAFFPGHCFLYVFASVYPFPAAIPGSGNVATTPTDARLTPVSWRLGAGRRGWTLKVGLCRVRAGSIPFPGLMRLASRTFPFCLGWVPGGYPSWKGFPSPSDSLPERVMA